MPESTTKFSDTSGREWDLRLDYLSLPRVRDFAHIDLGDRARLGETWGRLFLDDEKLLEVAWQILLPQAQSAGVSCEQFLAGMDGDSIQAAADALGVAIINFTRPLERATVKLQIETLKSGYETAMAQSKDQVASAMTAATAKALGPPPRNAQESSVTSTIAGRCAKRSPPSRPAARTSGAGWGSPCIASSIPCPTSAPAAAV